MAYQKNRVLAPHGWSAYSLLLDAGVTHPLAQLAEPAMNWTPGESDPSAQSTMVIVQGLQRMLKRIGIRTPMNGLLDPATQGVLAQAGGRSWRSQPWFQLYYLVRLKNFQRVMGPSMQAMSGLGAFEAPKESAIYGSIPTSEINCDRSDVCRGISARAKAAFKALQAAVGVTVDGAIGPKTVTATIAAIRPRWQEDPTNTIAKVVTTWDKGHRTSAVAGYADKIATFLTGKAVTAPRPPAPSPSVAAVPAPSAAPASPAFGPVQSASFFSGSVFGIPTPLALGAGVFAAAALGGMIPGLRGPAGKKPARRRRRKTTARRRRR